MLNSTLIEQFAGIHRQKKSGVLTVVGPGFRLRFCIEDGDPVGLDFCADKDLVLAQALLDFHKIGPEVHQMVVESRRLGKGSVADLVRRQQVVNEDEIAQVTEQRIFRPSISAYLRSLAASMGDYRLGDRTFDEAINDAREIGDMWGVATIIWKRAETELKKPAEQRDQGQESLHHLIPEKPIASTIRFAITMKRTINGREARNVPAINGAQGGAIE